jgi:ubiquinone/menaquinone biosynthesis C-methylase UbiE
VPQSSLTKPGAPSVWVRRFAGLATPGGEVLDLACGGGRHARRR